MEGLRSLYLQDMKLSGTRYRLMAALMISSQLLLTAFVLYWLMGQYREEKMQLYSELKKEYAQVHDQLVDSLLLKHLVIPSLDDSMMIKIHVAESLDIPEWIESDSVATRLLPQSRVLRKNINLDSFHLEGTLPHDTGVRTLDVTSVISEEERMVRSVKLFINQNQEAFQSDTGVFIYAMNLDSTSVLRNMASALEEAHPEFALEWPVRELSKERGSGIRGNIFLGEPDGPFPALEISHFGSYLIRSIWQQISFGLILLILSGSALLFAYRSLQRQVALNRLRNDFIGNISHELKTPVSTVKVVLEALRTYDQQKDPGKREEYLEMASHELARLETLVGKVLHHEMLDNPSLVLEKEACDPVALAQAAMKTLEIPIRQSGASVTLTGEGGSCQVQVDRVYVEGVIINLIDNSLKYAGGHPEISLYIACHPSGSTIAVADNGPGIPGEYKDQVFEKFFRIPSGNTHNVKGYGLGLNFASQVMAQHGGSISFENLPEGGCRFTLHFPNKEA